MRISDWSSDVCSSDLCLQETKVVDDLFPRDEIRGLGYPHLAISGMKGYNGVAILSKVPFARWTTRDWFERADCRHISAFLPDGTELHNLSDPAGGDVPYPRAHNQLTTGWATRRE